MGRSNAPECLDLVVDGKILGGLTPVGSGRVFFFITSMFIEFTLLLSTMNGLFTTLGSFELRLPVGDEWRRPEMSNYFCYVVNIRSTKRGNFDQGRRWVD